MPLSGARFRWCEIPISHQHEIPAPARACSGSSVSYPRSSDDGAPGLGWASRNDRSERNQRMLSPLRDRGIGLLIGAALTIACGAAYLLGGFERLDLFGLDLHFRYVSPIEADPRIVLVDIDDSTLRAAPEWPWPRRLHAELVRTLKELGADSIVLDFIFDRPSSKRFAGDPFTSGDAVNSDAGLRGPSTLVRPIDDDVELGDALAAAGNVFLAMYAEPVRNEPHDSASPHLERAVESLLEDFDQDVVRLAERLKFSPSDVAPQLAPIFTQAKRIAAERLAERFLGASPDGDWHEFRKAVLPSAADDEESADRNTLWEALRWDRALRSVLNRGSGSLDTPRATSPVPPLESFSHAARGVGIVSFERSHGSGVLRTLQPFVSVRQTRLAQLGVLVAADAKRMDLGTQRGDPWAWLQMNGDDPGAVAPLDEKGEALIAWIGPPVSDDWRSVFQHMSASPFLEIILNRDAMEENWGRFTAAMTELVRYRHAETPAEFQDYVRSTKRLTELLERTTKIPSGAEPSTLRAEVQRIGDSTRATEADALVWLRRTWELWSTVTPESAEEASQRESLRRLHEQFIERSWKDRVLIANDRLTERTERLLTDLRNRIRGRICLVGYTASAQGDLVTTPTLSSMPGVMAHAHIINMLLQGRVPRRAGAMFDVPLLLVLGAIVTGIACAWNAARSLLGCGCLASVMLLAAAGLFHARLVHLAAMVGCVECAVVWAGVTTYRQLTEERTRRRFQRALSQYTSPAIAAHLAGRVRAIDLAPHSAIVTCFFSDLRGFTRLSERLGPAGTRERLNPYLGAVSRALIDERAIVNKFIGDGVMAFFNAPILPCADHARAACRAALAARDAVVRLDVAAGFVNEDDRLHVRIGLATGEAFVGDYGTDTKLDYTCIGDTVNVASRLERANKSIGTQLLVDRGTREAAGDEFLFRPIGQLQVAGRQKPVECWELVGLASDAVDSQRGYVQAFAEAVRHFESGRWPECLAVLETCRSLRAADPLLDRYVELVTASQRHESGSVPVGVSRIPAVDGD